MGAKADSNLRVTLNSSAVLLTPVIERKGGCDVVSMTLELVS